VREFIALSVKWFKDNINERFFLDMPDKYKKRILNRLVALYNWLMEQINASNAD